MKRRYGVLIVFTLLCLSIGSTAWADLSVAKPEAVGLSSERLDRIGAILKADIEKGVIPGAVVLVARRGKSAYFESFGMSDLEAGTPMQKDSIFHIYSMTKPITSVGVMMLQEEGRIFLSDGISKYIPELGELDVGVEETDTATGQTTFSTVRAEREMTIQDLLRQTSGLTYSFFGTSKVNTMYTEAGVPSPDQSLTQMVEKLSKLPLAYQPGTTWEYGRSTDVLGRVIEIVSGTSLDRFFEDRILRPLQMNDTGFFVKEEKLGRVAKPGPQAKWPLPDFTALPKLLQGGQGLVSTASDYARFLQMLLNGGELDGVRLLGRKTVEYMTADHLGSIPKTGPRYFVGSGRGFGLGFAVREYPGVSAVPGSVGDYSWMGAGGTSFFVSPHEELFSVFMAQPNDMAKMAHYGMLTKILVMQAIVD
ncbi:MAG: serine hydrolase [Proteobacteria bacterium]|nr:serine hydrolase [Pseudomonadota bacterium]NIS70093.1 serine hydrolase [Pseudomonadota bacterium]